MVAAFVLVAWFLALSLTGSPLSDVLGWIAAVLVGVLAPGFVVVRVSRREVAPLIEDLSWAAAAGCLVALLGWFLDRVSPFSPGPFVVAPIVVVLGLLIPPARRRVLARPAPGWGAGPALALGVVMLVAIGWMLETGLLAYQPDPGAAGTPYYADIWYQLDLLGELRHHLVPTYPPVDGTSLSYHWFLYAIDAHLTTHTGVDSFDSTLRLAPASLVPAILMLAAVVARRLSGRVWAGPLGAALLGVVSISVASKWSTEDGSLEVLPRLWRASPPQTMGWLASMAAAGTLFAFLRRAPQDRAVPVALLVPFLVLTAGSKSSELPVLLAGVALAAAVQVLRRDWPMMRRCLLGLAGLAAVFLAASVTIYGGGSYGVKLRFWGVAWGRVFMMFPAHQTRTSSLYLDTNHVPLIAMLSISGLFVLPLLPRLIGVIFQVRYRPGDPTGWVCLGTAIAGLLVPFLVAHPAGSEVYFMLSAYPIGVVGAASGLMLAGDRVRESLLSPVSRRRFGRWLVLLVVAGVLSAAGVAYAQPRLDPLQRWVAAHPSDPFAHRLSERRMALLWWTPTVTLLLVLAALVLIAMFVVRRPWARPSVRAADDDGSAQSVRARRAPLILISAMGLLLGTGLYTTSLNFFGSDTPPGGSVAAVHPSAAALKTSPLLPTMRDGIAAGQWVDQHAKVDDVVASNMYCRFDRASRLHGKQHCDARNFIASALTQRHTLVGGWAYADRVVGSAWTLTVAYRNASFWNQNLLDEQYTAFAHPTRAVLNDLYLHHHVRWLYFDLRDKPVDIAGLDHLADRRFSGPTTGVWQLRSPS